MLRQTKRTDYFYEAIPYLYMVAGMLVAAVLPNLWGVFSGGVLILAGVMVLTMRRRYRKAERERLAARLARKRSEEAAAKRAAKDELDAFDDF